MPVVTVVVFVVVLALNLFGKIRKKQLMVKNLQSIVYGGMDWRSVGGVMGYRCIELYQGLLAQPAHSGH